MTIDIGINSQHRQAVAAILQKTLSDTFTLYVKTLNFHWNVEGKDFVEFHEFFGTQYTQLAAAIDEIAERIRALDLPSAGSMKEFLANTHLKEAPGKTLSADSMLKILLTDHETVIRNLRESADLCAEKYKDSGNNDFLIGLMQAHEKTAWMIRSYLK